MATALTRVDRAFASYLRMALSDESDLAVADGASPSR
jgi:hypothetical protein